MDTLVFHYNGSFWDLMFENPEYFDPSISYIRKYRKGGKFKRWLFKNPLVFITDFWHLLQFIKINTLCILVAINAGDLLLEMVVYFIICRLVYFASGYVFWRNRK